MSLCVARRAQARACLSTGTPCDRCFSDLGRACARGGGVCVACHGLMRPKTSFQGLQAVGTPLARLLLFARTARRAKQCIEALTTKSAEVQQSHVLNTGANSGRPVISVIPPPPPPPEAQDTRTRPRGMRSRGKSPPDGHPLCWGSDPTSGHPKAQKPLLGRGPPPSVWGCPLGQTGPTARAGALLHMDPTRSSDTGTAPGAPLAQPPKGKKWGAGRYG